MAESIVLKPFRSESTLLGTNAAGDTPGLAVNTNNQLQVEVVGGGTNKILGTSDPTATTNTNLYTVPATTDTLVRKLWCVNRGASKITVRIGIDVGGAGTNTPSDAEWIYYDLPLKPGQSLIDGDEFWLAATDDLVVYASVSDASFGASGEEHV